MTPTHFSSSGGNADVLAEAIAGWNLLRDAVTTDFRARFEYRRNVLEPGKPPDSEPCIVIECGVSATGSYLKQEVSGSTLVAAHNQEYFLLVERNSAGAPFELRNLVRGEELAGMRTELEDTWQPFLFAGFELSGKYLPDLIGSDQFQLLAFDVNAAAKVASMKFEYSPMRGPSEPAITSGRVSFATDRSWAITSFDCATIWGRLEGKADYTAFGGSYAPRSCEWRAHGKNGVLTVRTFDLKDIQRLAADSVLPLWLEDYGISR